VKAGTGAESMPRSEREAFYYWGTIFRQRRICLKHDKFFFGGKF